MSVLSARQWGQSVIAALILLLAVPYALTQAFMLWPAVDVTARVAQLDRALMVFPDSRAQRELALLGCANVSLLSDRVLHDTALALQQLPDDARLWQCQARLAERAGDVAQAAYALSRSIDSAAYFPPLLAERIMLGSVLWPVLGPMVQGQVAGQVGLLWQTKPNDLVHLARLAPLAARIEVIMRTYHSDAVDAFLQRRRPLRHTP